MKETIVLFSCLAFFSLACMSTASAMVIDTPAAEIGQTLTNESPAGAVYEIPEIIETRTSQICAVVIADRSLHLRKGPSEKDIVLTWLDRGDVVQVVSDLDPNWALVRYQDFLGYARAIYLRESECER